MPQSLANILVHVIFSTKNRARLIQPEIEGELYPCLASICRACDSPSYAIGGTEDHVHIALALGRTIAVAKPRPQGFALGFPIPPLGGSSNALPALETAGVAMRCPERAQYESPGQSPGDAK